MRIRLSNTNSHHIHDDFLRLVRQSLWEFLHRWWLNKSTDWFWSDSICLDQSQHTVLDELLRGVGDVDANALLAISWLAETKYRLQALQPLLNIGRDAAEPCAFEMLDRRSREGEFLLGITQSMRHFGTDFWWPRRLFALWNMSMSRATSKSALITLWRPYPNP